MIPVIEAICITGRQSICEYAILVAVPCGEVCIATYSYAAKNKGKIKSEYHLFKHKVADLLSNMIPAKISAGNMVNITAGISGATLARYPNQLNLPIRYAVKDMVNVTRFEWLTDKYNRGMGAIHTRYQ